MSPAPREGLDRAGLAAVALQCFAVEPRLGLCVMSPASPERDTWLAALRDVLPPAAPWRRVPLSCSPSRLEGDLDVAASLRLGRRITSPGLWADAGGGILLVPSAERIDVTFAAHLARLCDGRDDAGRAETGAGLLAMDEGGVGEAQCPAVLADRLALHVKLDGTGCFDPPTRASQNRVRSVRTTWPVIEVETAIVDGLCRTAAALGVVGLRAPYHAVCVAKVLAALAGRRRVRDGEAVLAAQLSLAPRARVLPLKPPSATEPSSTEMSDDHRASGEADAGRASGLDSLLIDAVRAYLPAALLDGSSGCRAVPGKAHTATGRSGSSLSTRHGRPIGSRPGRLEAGADIDLVATVQAATPWQRSRGRDTAGPLRLRKDDLRIARRRVARPTVTVFAVDASGSAAHGRLAEAKGAVELLLARSYARRDEVALVAFRGSGAELLLPHTRSLTRAQRELAALPGGGATPLAAGLDLAREVLLRARRDGREARLVVLTDGRGNISRDGLADRARAQEDGLGAATAIRLARTEVLVIDLSARPGSAAANLAAAMAARYLPLPHGDAYAIAESVAPTRAGAR